MQYWKYLLAARSAVEASHDSYTLLRYDMWVKSHVQKEQQIYVMGCLSTAGKLLSHFIVCSTTD